MILIFLIFLFQIICKVKSVLDAKSEQRYLVNDQLNIIGMETKHIYNVT